MENKTISNVLELRIDNLVYNKHMEVHRFSYMDFMNYRHPSMGGNYGFYSIPLTEEWLLKFGFIKKINNGSESVRYYWDGDIMIYVDENTDAMCLGDYDKYLDCKPFGLSEQKIKYVHQLQNIAFLLTGQELTIK